MLSHQRYHTLYRRNWILLVRMQKIILIYSCSGVVMPQYSAWRRGDILKHVSYANKLCILSFKWFLYLWSFHKVYFITFALYILEYFYYYFLNSKCFYDVMKTIWIFYLTQFTRWWQSSFAFFFQWIPLLP